MPVFSVDYSCHRIGWVAQLIDAVSIAGVLAGQLRRAVQMCAGGKTGAPTAGVSGRGVSG